MRFGVYTQLVCTDIMIKLGQCLDTIKFACLPLNVAGVPTHARRRVLAFVWANAGNQLLAAALRSVVNGHAAQLVELQGMRRLLASRSLYFSRALLLRGIFGPKCAIRP